MPLFLSPLQLDDFTAIIDHANHHPPGDDLVAAPNPIAWPVATHEAARQRLLFTMSKQKRRFLEDPSATFIKVVDAPTADNIDTGDIISLARWHYYPSGYDYASMSHWEMAEQLPGQDWPPSLRRELHDFVLLERDRVRKDWIGVGNPVWILTHLVTRQSQRGRGAAGMLINWGIDQSERSGVPIYLEAGSQGRPVYQKYGFEQVGDLRMLDLRPFGLEISFEMVNMVRWPKKASETSIGGT